MLQPFELCQVTLVRRRSFNRLPSADVSGQVTMKTYPTALCGYLHHT
jgi:hypothetical protein